MKYGLEVKTGDKWFPVRPPTAPPYEFDTRLEAETMGRVLYGAAVNREPEVVRVVEKEEA